MSKVKSYSKYYGIFLENGFEWFCYLFILGLFFSRFLLSASAVLLFLTAFLSFNHLQKKIIIKISHFLFPVVFTVFVLSYFNSSDIEIWKTIIFKNSVLFILPISFLLTKDLSRKKIIPLLFIFAFSAFICLTINTLNSFFTYQNFLKDISNSKNINPIIGPDHSELGVLSVVAFLIFFFLFITSKSKRKQVYLATLLIVCFLELHLIAYRFSLITIYTIGFGYLIYSIIFTRKWFHIALFGILVGGLTIAFFTIPSVKLRYLNTVQDIQSIIEHKNPNFQSLGQRWMAVKCASEIIKENPLIGVSPADATLEMNIQYTQGPYLLIPENRIFIHNQFIYYALAFGMPFLILFTILLVICLYKINQLSKFHFLLLLPFIFHMQIENTLEKQITGYAFIFLLLLNLKNESSRFHIH